MLTRLAIFPFNFVARFHRFRELEIIDVCGASRKVDFFFDKLLNSDLPIFRVTVLSLFQRFNSIIYKVIRLTSGTSPPILICALSGKIFRSKFVIEMINWNVVRFDPTRVYKNILGLELTLIEYRTLSKSYPRYPHPR